MPEKYRLKQPEYADVDLAMSAFWKMQPRDDRGRWSPTGWIHQPVEKVAAMKTSEEQSRYEFHTTAKSYVGVFNNRGEALAEASRLERVDFNSLVRAAVDDKGNVKDKQALTRLERHVEEVARISATLHESATDEEAPLAKVAEKAQEFGIEVSKDAFLKNLAERVAGIGARIAGSAVALIGLDKAEHFSEAFRHLTETIPGDATLNVAVALAVSALVTVLRKKFRSLRDQRIKKARLAVNIEKAKKKPPVFGPAEAATP